MESNNQIYKQNGWLELIFGCMFSGKTSALEKIYKQHKICNIKCLVINYTGDTRYSNTMLSTHDNTTIPCIFESLLQDINIDLIHNNEVILINEGQFFKDLVPWVISRLQEKKIIYICGLDGDFQQNKFGSMLDLIPKADMYYKLTAICAHCRSGAVAPFSYRKSNDTTQTLIGSDEYIPVCRTCMTTLCSK